MKRYIYIMGHQEGIKGYIKGYIKGTSILILFINTLYKYNNTKVNMKRIFMFAHSFFSMMKKATNNIKTKAVIPVSVAGVPGICPALGGFGSLELLYKIVNT